VKLRVEPVKRGADIFNFSFAMVVLALAQARSAEVEAQHGKPKAVQRLRGVENDFVVEHPAEQRVRMANDRSASGGRCAFAEQRFQPSGGTLEEERTNRRIRYDHLNSLHKQALGFGLLIVDIRKTATELRSAGQPRAAVPT